MYEVILYEDAQGRSPVKEFIDELDEQAQQDKRAKVLLKKVIRYIDHLQLGGTRIGEPFIKHLEGDVWELSREIEGSCFLGGSTGRLSCCIPL